MSLLRSEEGRDRGSISDLSPSLGKVSRLRILLSAVCEGIVLGMDMLATRKQEASSFSVLGTGSSLGGGSRLHLSMARVELFLLVPSTVYLPSRFLAPASLQGRGSFSDT